VSELKLNLRGTDLDKATAGVWIEYEEGISFRIARANTPGYRDALKKMTRQHKRQIEQGTLSDAKSDRLMAELMADWILLDWKGMKNGKEDFPYSRENARAFLSAEQYADIKEWIMQQALEAENYRAETQKK